MPYQDTSSYDRRIEALLGSGGGNSYAGGLAAGIRALGAKKLFKKRDEAAAGNDALKTQEMQRLVTALQRGGTEIPMQPGMTQNFSHPDVQQLALAAALKKQDARNYGLSPITMKGPDGSYVPGQLSSTGGITPVQLPEGMSYVPDSGRMGFDPTLIQQRGNAENNVRTTLEELLTPILANRAGATTAATEQAQTAAIPGQMAAETQGLVDRTQTQTQQTRGRDAMAAIELLDMAEPLLDVATGSGAGVARDKLGAIFGWSGDGAQAAAELAALGGLLVSKMPRMEGPQSNYDQQLYREMAGQIGDASIPNDTRKAALRTIRMLNEKYAAPAASGRSIFEEADEILARPGVMP